MPTHSKVFRLPILNYHNISDNIDYYTAVKLNVFKKQIKTLLNNFSYIDLESAFKVYKQKRSLKYKFSVTFDDGYGDIIPAIDFLEKNKAPATLFIPTDSIGKDNRWNYKATYITPTLSRLQIKKMSRKGHLIGSHGRTHQCLTKLTERELLNEIVESKRKLEKIVNKEVGFFAYPFGYHDERVRDLTSKYYKAAFSTNKTAENINWNDVFQIYRLSVNKDTTLKTIINCIKTSYEN